MVVFSYMPAGVTLSCVFDVPVYAICRDTISLYLKLSTGASVNMSLSVGSSLFLRPVVSHVKNSALDADEFWRGVIL